MKKEGKYENNVDKKGRDDNRGKWKREENGGNKGAWRADDRKSSGKDEKRSHYEFPTFFSQNLFDPTKILFCF